MKERYNLGKSIFVGEYLLHQGRPKLVCLACGSPEIRRATFGLELTW